LSTAVTPLRKPPGTASVNLNQAIVNTLTIARHEYDVVARCSAQALLEHGNFAGPSAEACDRADARDRAVGVPAPAGAHRMGARPRLGRRAVDLVPLHALVRNAQS
jgi:hypothetical protein